MPRRLLVWILAPLLLLAPLALADEDEEDGGEGSRAHDDRRKLELDVGDHKVEIKLERDLSGVEESVKIEFDAESAKVQVKHEEETRENESEGKLEARFLSLIEFVDANGNDAYNVGETIASAWALGEDADEEDAEVNGSVAWGPLEVADAVSGNTTGKKISSRAEFGPNATFGLDLYVYGDFTLAGNAPLEPTEAKIDVVILHYPFIRNDSRLAVLVDLEAEEEFKTDEAGEGEEGLASEGASGNLTFRLTFTWLETATVDGVERPVHSTVLQNKEEAEGDERKQKARVALSYPRGDHIIHDPTVGVSYGTQGAGARDVPLPPLGLAAAAVGLAALARRRH